MSADSSEGGLISRPDGPLFRFGEPTERFESVVHSLLLIAGAFVASIFLVSLGNSVLETLAVTAVGVTETVPTALHFLAFILVSVAYLEWRGDRSLVGLRWPTKRDAGLAVVGTLFLFGLMITGQLLLDFLGVELADNVAVERGQENPELFLYYIPLVLLLNVPAEELLFRGVIQGLFRRAYGIVPGILAASAIFGLIHYVALVGEGSAMAYVAIAFASGILLGAAYELTGNLVVPVVMHAVWNTFVYLNLFVGATGGL